MPPAGIPGDVDHFSDGLHLSDVLQFGDDSRNRHFLCHGDVGAHVDGHARHDRHFDLFGDLHGLHHDLHDHTRCCDVGDDRDGHFDCACDRHLLLRDHLDGARDGGLHKAAERQSLDRRPAGLRSKSNLSVRRLLHRLVDDGEHAALITVLPVALADRTRVLRCTPIGSLDKFAESVGAKLVTAALRLDVHTRSTAPNG